MPRIKRDTSISYKDIGIRHMGVIMDGNGRWAKRRGMPRTLGHKAGAKVFRDISEHCRLSGLEILTVYAFSTENWKRPKDEVDAIINLLREYLDEVFADKDHYIRKNMRVCFIGDLEALDSDIVSRIHEIEDTTRDMTGMTLNIAVNYGGRSDIAQAARRLARQVKMGALEPEDITEERLGRHLYTKGGPDPDIILRTGGDFRLSNFMLWQSAYAEYISTQTLWPDFKARELDKLVDSFRKRERRFGGVKE